MFIFSFSQNIINLHTIFRLTIDNTTSFNAHAETCGVWDILMHRSSSKLEMERINELPIDAIRIGGILQSNDT